jgi:hypothetical protein
MFSEKVEVSENAMPCNDPAINNAATQGEALARTDARSDHAVLDFSLVTFICIKAKESNNHN